MSKGYNNDGSTNIQLICSFALLQGSEVSQVERTAITYELTQCPCTTVIFHKTWMKT